MKNIKTKRKTSAETIVSKRRPLLEGMFVPKSVAVIGASEKPGSVGRALVENLQPFRGRVFLVNPNHSTILGEKAYPTINAAMEDVAEPAEGGQLLQTKSHPDRR